MSQNYPELAGVQTELHQLVEKLNHKLREGSLLGIGDVLADIQVVAREADWTVSRLIGNRAIAELRSEHGPNNPYTCQLQGCSCPPNRPDSLGVRT